MDPTFDFAPRTEPLHDVVYQTRVALSDQPRVFSETLVSTGDTNKYSLPVSPVSAASIQVFLDGDFLQDQHYAVEEATGTLLFHFVPDKDSLITVHGVHYRFFTDEELAYICTDSFAMHAKGRTDVYGRNLTITTVDRSEFYPLSLLCAINALYVLATDAAFDIDIQAPDGLMIPRSQRYQHLMGMIEQLRGRYAELSALLGIGMYAIEVFTYRRISKRTNRYVPVYRPQEIDDRSRPERVYLPIPTYGGQVVDDGIPDLDIIVNQGDTFAQTIKIPEVVIPPWAKLRAQIRGYAGSPVISGEFYCLRVDAHTVVISMSHEQSVNIPSRAVWDLQMDVQHNPAFGPEFSSEFNHDASRSFTTSQTLRRGRMNSPREVTTSYGQPGVWPAIAPAVTGVTTQTSAPWSQGYHTNQGSWDIGYNP